MRCAMFFSVYTFVRPDDIRYAEWSEIKGDFRDIIAEKMKMKQKHIVPLSSQVRAVLDELPPLTGNNTIADIGLGLIIAKVAVSNIQALDINTSIQNLFWERY